MKPLLVLTILMAFAQALTACHDNTKIAEIETNKKPVQPISNHDATKHAHNFADTYTTYCRYIKNLSMLEEMLIGRNTIDSGKAKEFLNGHEGKGYIIPSPIHQDYDVIVLIADRLNMCTVVANNIDINTVLQNFQDKHIESIDSPIKITQTKNSVNTTKNGTQRMEHKESLPTS